MSYAIVKNNVVENIVEWDGKAEFNVDGEKKHLTAIDSEQYIFIIDQFVDEFRKVFKHYKIAFNNALNGIQGKSTQLCKKSILDKNLNKPIFTVKCHLLNGTSITAITSGAPYN